MRLRRAMATTPDIPADLNIARTAELARLKLTPEECSSYTEQLSRILAHVAQLAAADTAGVEPTAHPIDAYDVMRADTARPGLPVELMMANAPRRVGDQILVPRVVE